MTRRDFLIKWAAYVLAFLPVWAVALFFLPRWPIFGTVPVLLSTAAILVAVLEGPTAGAGYGLFVGIVADAFLYQVPGSLTVGYTLLCFGAGLLAKYRVQQDFSGCCLCAFLGLCLLDLVQVASLLFREKATLGAALWVAVGEIFWSMVFVPLLYLLYRWVFDRVPKPGVLQ